jgi:coproporphyrinogen III oxidase
MLTDTFLLELKQKYLDAFAPYIQDPGFEKKSWELITKAGDVEVNASRGDLFEKVCVSNISATVTIPDRDWKSSIQWLGIQTFPSNPLVPMFMGVFEHVDEKGLEHHPAYFDIYPVVPIEEDKQYFQEVIGTVCKKYDRKYPDLPESYLEMFRLKEVGIGVGYGVGLSLMPDEKDHDYFMDVASAIREAYFEIVERRKNAPYTRKQVEEMNEFRKLWVKFIFMDNRFFSGGVQLGVPPESFMIHMLPPSVRF